MVTTYLDTNSTFATTSTTAYEVTNSRYWIFSTNRGVKDNYANKIYVKPKNYRCVKPGTQYKKPPVKYKPKNRPLTKNIWQLMTYNMHSGRKRYEE